MIAAAAEAVVVFAYCSAYGFAGVLTVVQMVMDYLFGWVDA